MSKVRATAPRHEKSLDQTQDPAFLKQFRQDMQMRGLSTNTKNAYIRDLRACMAYSQTPLDKWTSTHVIGFFAYLQSIYTNPRTQARMMASLRQFFNWRVGEGLQDDNPCERIAPIRPKKPLPKSLTKSEVESLLNINDPSALGVRDKAMLEVLYACGLRVSELVGLEFMDVNLEAGWLSITNKAGKTRLVPLGDNAISALKTYLSMRHELIPTGKKDCQAVFLTEQGGYMTRHNFWHMIKKYARLANIDKDISPHTLRHAFAVHLVNHGTDLKSVQLLLGHKDLSTTQIYAHVAKARLQALQEDYHPRA